MGNELWEKQSELVGVDLNERAQLDLLSCFVSRFKDEYESFPQGRTSVPHQYYVNNGGLEAVDGEMLYCMIRYFRPTRIIEVGAGNSTCLSAQAVLKNKEQFSQDCTLIAIDPRPSRILRAGFPGLSKVVTSRVQQLPLSEFLDLEENDILFIDSSHVLKIGSDVQYEYLEILPRLKKGVIVHAHDIFSPAEYPKQWVVNWHRFWTEQYLLQAFLTFNCAFEILCAAHFLHLHHPDRLEAAFSSYRRQERCPGSFWMRKIV